MTLLLGAILWAVGGCARSTPEAGSSESHFLTQCESSCPDGLLCVCGLCSTPCQNDTVCDGLAGAARCLAPNNLASACAPSETVCDVACSADRDCDTLGNDHDYECERGRCRRRATTVVDQAQAKAGDGAGDKPDPDRPPVTPPSPTCDDLADGQSRSRVRYESETAGPAGCLAEMQVQLCNAGVLSDWTGSYTAERCSLPNPPIMTGPDAPKPMVWESECAALETGASKPEPLSPDERCFEFRVHADGDMDAPFDYQPGESLGAFYFDAPWPSDAVATRIITEIDNPEVARFQYTFLTSRSDRSHGQVLWPTGGEETLRMDAHLLSMSRPGSCPTVMPDGVGLSLPSETLVMVQWLAVNATGEHQLDRSAVHICTVPRDRRDRLAGVVVLGTENLNDGMSIGFGAGRHSFAGQCTFGGPDKHELLSLSPLMRSYGIGAQLNLREGSETETLLDAPFAIDTPLTYRPSPALVVPAGATLEAGCSYDNPSDWRVSMGISEVMEACYHLAVIAPPPALPPPVNLVGAYNACF